jgi:putative aminopeptidase FrvX
VRPIGRFDPRVLPGQPVTIHGHKPIEGLIVVPPPHCLPPDKRSGSVDTLDLLVDTCLPATRLSALVSPGDVVTFAQSPMEIGEGILAGPYLDNRASLAALTQCLRELSSRRHGWDVTAAATVQEEVTAAGGRTAGFDARPTIAVIIDVTYGRSPGLPEHLTFPMGGGPTNGWGPHVHPGMHDYIRECAERAGIPLATELMPVNSLTEADQVQRVAGGIPTAIVGLPIRYMHSPVEMVYIQDVWMTGRLLAEIVTGLSPKFMSRLSWN